MKKNSIKENMTFWEGWDDEKVWVKIDEVLRKKRRKRFFIYFLFFTVLGIPMILSLSSTEKTSNNKNNGAKHMDCGVNDKSSPLALRIGNNSNAPGNESSDISKNIITGNAAQYKVKKHTTSNKHSKNDSNKINLSLTEFISIEKDKESSSTPIFISQENPENLYYASDKFSEVTNIPIYLTLIPESFKNNNDLKTSIENHKHKLCLTENLKKPAGSNNSFLTLQYSSGIGVGVRQDYFDENIEWQKLKHNNEKYLYSISHSLKISKVLHSNWKLNVGIGYISHISKLKGVNIQMQQTLVPSDSARYQNINGTNYYHNGYLVKTTTTRQNYDVVNSYSSYLIPFSITYTKQIKNHQFILGIGSQINLINEFNGYTYNEVSKIEKINLVAKKNIHGSFGLNSINTSLGYCQNINSNLGVMMEIEYCIPLLPTYIQDNPSVQVYKSNYSFGQFKLGVQYRLK